MTSSSQLGAREASVLPADARRAGTVAAPRPLPPGVGLTIGAAVSLGLWAGLAQLAIRLIG